MTEMIAISVDREVLDVLDRMGNAMEEGDGSTPPRTTPNTVLRKLLRLDLINRGDAKALLHCLLLR